MDFFLSFVAPSVPAPPEQCIPDFSPLLLPCKCYAVESQSLARAFGVDTPSPCPRSNLLCHHILSYMVLFIPLTSAQSPFCLQTFPRHPPGCATSKVLQKPFLDIFFIVFLRSQATALTGNRNLFSLEHSQEAVVFPPPTPHIPQSPGAERVSFMAPIAADRQFFSS